MTLAEWMKTEGKTMDFVAKSLGTSRQSVHTWVSGRNAPRIYYALAVEVLSEGKVPVEVLADAHSGDGGRGLQVTGCCGWSAAGAAGRR